jgi:hypothetical protein
MQIQRLILAADRVIAGGLCLYVMEPMRWGLCL